MYYLKKNPIAIHSNKRLFWASSMSLKNGTCKFHLSNWPHFFMMYTWLSSGLTSGRLIKGQTPSKSVNVYCPVWASQGIEFFFQDVLPVTTNWFPVVKFNEIPQWLSDNCLSNYRRLSYDNHENLTRVMQMYCWFCIIKQTKLEQQMVR